MTVITVEKRLIVAAGHHRRPRTTPTWQTVHDPTDPDQPPNDYTIGSMFAHNFKAAFNDGDADLVFAFASVSDGTHGSTSIVPSISTTVGATMTRVVGWYVAQGTGPTGQDPTVEFVDAFSEGRGDFVDDFFVTVSSDPALTAAANDVGEVPTATAETLVAAASVPSTGEMFDSWIGGAATDATDEIAAGSNGIAIATYRHPDPGPTPRRPEVIVAEGVRILAGLIAGGDGWVMGPDGVIHHVDPGWGTLIERAARAATVSSLSRGFEGAAEITKLSLVELDAAVHQLHTTLARVNERGLGR